METKRRKKLYCDPLFGSPKPKELLKVNGSQVEFTRERPVYEQTPEDYSVNSILSSGGDPNQGSTFEHQPDISETDSIMNVVTATAVKLDSQTNKKDEK